MNPSPNQTAIITGAGSGIGRAAALALLNAGWQVVLAGRRAAPLAETAALANAGTAALAIPTDVTDPQAVEALFAQTVQRFGRLDLLFNNAGNFTHSINFGDLTFAQWKATTGVNLDGMFLCANAAFRQMRAQTPQGGRIINNGSLSAQTPRPGAAPYTVSKHAITGLTKAISLDGRALNIACGQIDIGNAATEITDGMVHGALQADGRIVPEPRMDVADVASTLLLMASMPLQSNVQFVTVLATAMPFIGRG